MNRKVKQMMAVLMALVLLSLATGSASAKVLFSDPVSPTVNLPKDPAQEEQPSDAGEGQLPEEPLPEEPLPEEPLPVEEAVVTLKSAEGSLNVRAAANSDSELLAKIPNGARVVVLGTEGNWLLVQYETIVGYVYSEYMEILPPATEEELPEEPVTEEPLPEEPLPEEPLPEEPQPAEEAQVALEGEEGSLNVYAAASADSEVLGQLPNGARAVVLGTEGDWLLIQYETLVGYVDSQYMEILTPAAEEGIPEEPAPAEEAVVTLEGEEGSLNVYAEASEESELLGQIPNGARVVVLGTEGDWMLIQYETLVGYVNSQYMQPAPPEGELLEDLRPAGMINIRDNIGSAVHYGDIITLTAELLGFEDVPYTLQWMIRNSGGDWQEISGETGLSITFELTPENAASEWQLRVLTE